MSIIVTGAAGFVGCNLIKTLLEGGQKVVGIDNLSRGKEIHLKDFAANKNFQFHQADIADYDRFLGVLRRAHEAEPVKEVWHLAANSDIPAGVADASVDLRDTFMTTYNILQAMKLLQIPVMAFASSSAIYGEIADAPLTETTGPLLPISNYGAMKLASEAAIAAAAENHLKQVFLFRFPNVIGTPATHGVIYDFIRRLRAQPDRLEVLGDGNQQKSYLHVDDLVEAMLFVRKKSKDRISCFNIGAGDDGVSVRFIADETVAAVSPGARITYGTGDRGWVGDVPRFRYSIDKLCALGWRPETGSAETVRRAIHEIAAQEQL